MVVLAPLAAAGCSEPVPVPLACTETFEMDGTIRSATGRTTYDSPEFPWYSEQKAESLRDAVLDALPGGVEVDALEFGPLMVGASDPMFDGIAKSWSGVESPRGHGTLFLAVEQSDEPVPPCIKDRTLHREQLADGTILEHRLSERDKYITYSVIAYQPDGSRVMALSTNEHTDQDTMTDTFVDQPALSLDELAAIATAPGVDAQPLDG